MTHTDTDVSWARRLPTILAPLLTLGQPDPGEHIAEASEVATNVVLAGPEVCMLAALSDVPDAYAHVRGALTSRALEVFEEVARIGAQQQAGVLRARSAAPEPVAWTKAALAAHAAPRALDRVLELRNRLEASRRQSAPSEAHATLAKLEAYAESVLCVCMVRPSLAGDVLRSLGLDRPEDLQTLASLEGVLQAAYRGEFDVAATIHWGIGVVNRLYGMRAAIPPEYRFARDYGTLVTLDAPPEVLRTYMACRALHAVVLGTFVRCTRLYTELPEDKRDACIPWFFVMPSVAKFEPDIFTQESLNP